MDSSAITNWIENYEAYGPFYLYETKPNKLTKGSIYFVIFKDDQGVKLGSLSDGMYIQGGIGTFGILSGPSKDDLWQPSKGLITKDHLNYMIKLYHNEDINLPIFNLRTIKDLKHG